MHLIPLDKITDNPYQTRRVYDDIPELARRIRSELVSHPETLGLLQVPMGRLVADDGEIVPLNGAGPEDVRELLAAGATVQLAFGHRRKRAFEWLSRHAEVYAGEMPVRLVDLTDEDMIDAVWSENHDRRDISAVEEAELLQQKLSRPNGDGKRRSQRDVAQAWGLGRSTVANRLRVLQAPAGVREANRRGELSERQCLALITVAKLAGMAPPEVEWGHEPDPRGLRAWDWTPPPPGEFLEWVVTDGQDITSDEIRAYAKEALAHAGAPLPAGIAQRTIEREHPHLKQPSCRGCDYRLHETCLDPRFCLHSKKQIYGQLVAQETADELDLPYSENSDDFAAFDAHAACINLQNLYEAGGCEHLVVGWRDAGYGARPFHKHMYINDGFEPDLAYKQGSKAGVILGHEGPLTEDCWPEDAEKTEEERDPLQEGYRAWKEEAEAQVADAAERVRTALAQRLRQNVPEHLLDGLDLLLAGTTTRSGYKADLPAAERAQDLVERAWDRFWGWRQARHPRSGLEALEQVCEAACLPREILAQERMPEREALRLLAAWCHERRYHASVNVASELQEPVARVLAQLGGDGGHEDLVEPLALVEAEIENVLEAAASEEEE